MPSIADYIGYMIGILGIIVAALISLWIYRKQPRSATANKDHNELIADPNIPSILNMDGFRNHDMHSNVFNIANKVFDFIPIVSSWKPDENEYYFGSLKIIIEDKDYIIPDDIIDHFSHKSVAFQEQINRKITEPKVRINNFNFDISGENKFNHLIFSFSKITYKDFLIANCCLDEKPAREEYYFRDKYFKYNDSIIIPELANICGVGIFILTDDKKIIISKASEHVTVNPKKYIYSASGTMNWDDNADNINPFYDIMRECEEEIEYRPKIENLTLYSFGLDYKLGYYQFSFYTKTNMTGEEIVRRAGMARDFHFEMDHVQALDFNCKSIVNHIKSNDWDSTAASNLLTLASKFFGKEEVEKQIDPQFVNEYYKQELLFEWEKRAKRNGKSAVLSIRYPLDRIDDISDDYVRNVIDFIDEPLKGKTIIEIGGGIGLFTKYLAKNAKSITVIEMSKGMIDRNKAYLGQELSKTVRYVNCFFQEYYEDYHYDIMICSLVLIHNFYDIENMVQNMCRKAKTIYLFEQIDGGQGSKITKSQKLGDYVKLFPDYRLEKTKEYYLFTDKIGFLKLVKK